MGKGDKQMIIDDMQDESTMPAGDGDSEETPEKDETATTEEA